MEKVPTLKDLIVEKLRYQLPDHIDSNQIAFTGIELQNIAIEFAKLHVQAALDSVAENIESLDVHSFRHAKEIVFNSYSINNIK